MTSRQTTPSLLAVLRHRPFSLFWVGNLISGVGIWMQNLTQGWLVLELSNSSFYLGLLGFASLIPTLILSLLGGVLADRIDRRRLLLATQTSLMLIALILAVLTWLGLISPWLIIWLALLSGIVVAMNSPAYQAVVPDLVPPEELTQAIALNSIQFNIARIAGHASAGAAVAMIGVAGCFLLNGLTYLVMIAVLSFITFSSRHIERDPVNLRSRFNEGIAHVIGSPDSRNLILLSASISLFGLPYFFFLPAFARDILEAGPQGLGLLTAAVSTGALVGGLLIPYMAIRFGKHRIVEVCAVGFWCSLIGFSLSRFYVLSCVLLIMLGIMLAITLSTSNNLLQEQTPPEKRGRTMSFQSLAVNGLAPVGAFLFGLLSESISAPSSLLIFSLAGLSMSSVIVFNMNASQECAIHTPRGKLDLDPPVSQP